MSPSSYIDCQLFMLISISNIASCISTVVRRVFPIVLYNICFISPIIRSNCPQHHGALLRFNFHFIFSLARKSLNSTFVYVLYPFRCIIALSQIFALSQQMTCGLPLLAINRLSALITSLVVWFGNTSKWTALLILHVYRSMQTLISFSDLVFLTVNWSSIVYSNDFERQILFCSIFQ